MNLDWARLRAVVLESDDWGLCAWVPDREAWTALAGTPAFRSPAGERYGGSTLESAADVKALAGLLLEHSGGDGFPPVWQANTVMANPDYARLASPALDAPTIPLVDLPDTPGRWSRPAERCVVTRAWTPHKRSEERRTPSRASDSRSSASTRLSRSWRCAGRAPC